MIDILWACIKHILSARYGWNWQRNVLSPTWVGFVAVAACCLTRNLCWWPLTVAAWHAKARSETHDIAHFRCTCLPSYQLYTQLFIEQLNKKIGRAVFHIAAEWCNSSRSWFHCLSSATLHVTAHCNRYSFHYSLQHLSDPLLKNTWNDHFLLNCCGQWNLSDKYIINHPVFFQLTAFSVKEQQ